MTSVLIAASIGLFSTLLFTPVAIRVFRALGWGQRVREPGPHSPAHQAKMGTPTMGGLLIIGGLAFAYLLTGLLFGRITVTGLLVLGAGAALAGIGFLDDLLKVRKQRSLGLGKAAKLVGQATVAILFAWGLVRFTDISTDLSFIRDTGLDLGIGFFAWVFIMIAGSSNGVNLTDGLDGLASGSTAMVFAAYVIIAFWQFRHTCGALPVPSCYPVELSTSLDLAILSAAALGAIAGFLWWNAAPARIFMGDTGSLALGGLAAAMAIATRTQLLLLVLGGLFVLEVVSVILQVVSFRVFGRRLFRMAPIHHHFEVLGWHEFTVIVRFWIVAGLAVIFGLGLFYADFLTRGGVT
ncbi:MAG TPA: phospho-N-acetylmuramoyl-pentapeptide-transferase [Actinomycetota bacterium]|nr:phospho-N-acetylmuramoyl-pentapeptide-transferase [Actinomycetota bacterium]